MDYGFIERAFGLLRDINKWYVLVPVIIGVIRYRKLDRQQRVVFAIAILTVMNDHITIQLVNAYMPNVWVLHVYVPFLLILITILYKTEDSLILSTKALNLFAIAFVGFSLLNSLFIQGLESWPSNMILVGSVFYIVLSVIYFSDLLRKPKLKLLDKSPMFWFNSGLLLYNASAFLLFLFVTNILAGSDSVLIIGFSLNAIFNLVLLTSYSIALWVKPQA